MFCSAARTGGRLTISRVTKAEGPPTGGPSGLNGDEAVRSMNGNYSRITPAAPAGATSGVQKLENKMQSP